MTNSEDYNFRMAACDLLIYRTYLETWKRGEKYAREGRVKVIKVDDKSIIAVVKGSKSYNTVLAFKSGGLSRNCSCPVNDFCKHIVALAIVWDKMRGIPTPTETDVENETVPPPLVSRVQIEALYKDPVNADLEILRMASSESGAWSRPHARLPNKPRFISQAEVSLSIQELEQAFREISKWANRRNYDFYFCAGEMVAAFCEIIRLVKKRLPVTPPLLSAEILRESQKFHYKLIMELIDDSDGLHEFTEAHLQDLYNILTKLDISKEDESLFKAKLREFIDHKDDY